MVKQAFGYGTTVFYLEMEMTRLLIWSPTQKNFKKTMLRERSQTQKDGNAVVPFIIRSDEKNERRSLPKL